MTTTKLTTTRAPFAIAVLVVAFVVAIGCGGQEGGSDVDARADASAEGGACTVGVCTLDPSGPSIDHCCSDDAGVDASDTRGSFDVSDASDAPKCSIGDALVSDASCAAGDADSCGAGEVCAVEIGGPMKRGATWCVTIPPECGGVPTCPCMGVCACGSWRCVDGTIDGEIFCDDGTI
jgi:hypothetical protein